MLPDFQNFDIPLHARQLEVSLSPARFRVLVSGRRFGKTHLALAEMLRAAQTPGSLIWYVGPNDGQSKRIAWQRLKKLTETFWAKRPNESELRIVLNITLSGPRQQAGLTRPPSAISNRKIRFTANGPCDPQNFTSIGPCDKLTTPHAFRSRL